MHSYHDKPSGRTLESLPSVALGDDSFGRVICETLGLKTDISVVKSSGPLMFECMISLS